MDHAEDAGGRSKALRAATSGAHVGVDSRITAAHPFESRELYGRFLLVQHAFHRDIDALYADDRLGALLPGLPGRRRLPLIEQDLADLGIALPAAAVPPIFASGATVPTALGWLYVSEGSNLGAAFLLKEAAKLDLSEAFGARHLAAHPEGRGASWRTFTAALDAVSLSPDDEAVAVAGAKDAFGRVRDLVEQLLPLREPAPVPDAPPL